MESRLDVIVCHAFDTHAFLSAALARDDRHRAFGNAQSIGKNFDQFSIGSAVDWSSVEPHQDRVAAHTGDT
jgi:hypothetical protein